MRTPPNYVVDGVSRPMGPRTLGRRGSNEGRAARRRTDQRKIKCSKTHGPAREKHLKVDAYAEGACAHIPAARNSDARPRNPGALRADQLRSPLGERVPTPGEEAFATDNGVCKAESRLRSKKSGAH